MSAARCAVCGRPGHRYGTTDTEHAPDAIACVNGLLGEIDELVRQRNETRRHVYVSTACQHELHATCRLTCKFCAAPCRCDCHEDQS